jgi:hypothetical protein
MLYLDIVRPHERRLKDECPVSITAGQIVQHQQFVTHPPEQVVGERLNVAKLVHRPARHAFEPVASRLKEYRRIARDDEGRAI